MTTLKREKSELISPFSMLKREESEVIPPFSMLKREKSEVNLLVPIPEREVKFSRTDVSISFHVFAPQITAQW
jgi:hypothetical protein